MEKEARSFLTSRGKNWLQMEYGRLLREKVWSGHQQQDGTWDQTVDECAPEVYEEQSKTRQSS